MLGLSPTLVRALIPKGEPEPDLSSLRAITTTGEPWNAGPYDWLNEHVAGGGRIPIVNISGGTEVGACFLSVTPMAPTKPVSLGFPALGLAMDVYSPEGSRCAARSASFVCTQGLAGHDAGHLGRRRALPRDVLAPLPRASGRTATGPRSTRTATGSCTAARTTRSTSRASGSAPPSSSRPALEHPAVAEAAAIGVPHEVKGETAWIYCALKPGAEADADGIKATVAAALGKAFAPERSSSSRRCRRRARRRSSAAPCARRRSARTRATSRRWRIRTCWRRSDMRLGRWSPAAAAGSAPGSRASSPAPAGT